MRDQNLLWLNRTQREGIARVLDGFIIGISGTLATYVAGKIELSASETVTLVCLDLSCFLSALILRKDAS